MSRRVKVIGNLFQGQVPAGAVTSDARRQALRRSPYRPTMEPVRVQKIGSSIAAAGDEQEHLHQAVQPERGGDAS